MGLDSFVYASKNGEQKEICYWRKHHELHDWMWTRWKRLSPSHDYDFNLIPMELTPEILDELEDDLTNKRLIQDPYYRRMSEEEQIERDLADVETCREYIQKGYLVEYDSFW